MTCWPGVKNEPPRPVASIRLFGSPTSYHSMNTSDTDTKRPEERPEPRRPRRSADGGAERVSELEAVIQRIRAQKVAAIDKLCEIAKGATRPRSSDYYYGLEAAYSFCLNRLGSFHLFLASSETKEAEESGGRREERSDDARSGLPNVKVLLHLTEGAASTAG